MILSLEEVYELALKNSIRLFLLYGEMGAGKTYFVKNFLKAPEVCSPTYSVVHKYNLNNLQIAHYDLYKIKENELESCGFFEDLRTCSMVFVEWADNAPSLKKIDKKMEIFFKDFQMDVVV